MPYTFTITEVVNNIAVTTTSSPVTVNVENIQFTVTQTSQNLAVTQYLNTVTVYENAIELRVDDFSNTYKGDWLSGTTYTRGDLVNYAYSFYVSNIATATTYVSTTPPPQDQGSTGSPDSVGNYSNAKWRRVVWNEAPRNHLTITNALQVGTTVSIGGSTTIGGDASVSGNTTMTGTLYVGQATTLNKTLSVAQTATIETLVLNQAMSQLTVTNALKMGSAVVDRTAQINGTATIETLVLNQAMSQLTVTNLIRAGSLAIGGATSNGGVAITGPLSVSGTSTFASTATFLSDLNVGAAGRGFTVTSSSTFNGSVLFNSTATFRGDVDLSQSNITMQNLTVTNQLNVNKFAINGLQFATTAGNYGQVLFTNGDKIANWTYLGDLILWSLSSNLITNGFNIISGNTATNLKIGIGDYNNGITGPNIEFKNTASIFTGKALLPVNSRLTSNSTDFFETNANVLRLHGPSQLGISSSEGTDSRAVYLMGDVYGDVKLLSGNPNPYWINADNDGNISRLPTNQEIADSILGDYANRSAITFGSRVVVSDYGIKFSDGTVQTTAGQGTVGYTGSRGSNGTNGYTGSQGSGGNTGYTGSAGAKGDAGGYTGSAGSNGYTGSAGTNGSNGYNGSQGVIGYTGSASSLSTVNLTNPLVTNGYDFRYDTNDTGKVINISSSSVTLTASNGQVFDAVNYGTSALGLAYTSTNWSLRSFPLSADSNRVFTNNIEITRNGIALNNYEETKYTSTWGTPYFNTSTVSITSGTIGLLSNTVNINGNSTVVTANTLTVAATLTNFSYKVSCVRII